MEGESLLSTDYYYKARYLLSLYIFYGRNLDFDLSLSQVSTKNRFLSHNTPL